LSVLSFDLGLDFKVQVSIWIQKRII